MTEIHQLMLEIAVFAVAGLAVKIFQLFRKI